MQAVRDRGRGPLICIIQSLRVAFGCRQRSRPVQWRLRDFEAEFGEGGIDQRQAMHLEGLPSVCKRPTEIVGAMLRVANEHLVHSL